MKKLFIGIDVSAEKLDICLKQEKKMETFIIKNKSSDIKKFFKPSKFENKNVVLGMENTGEYNNYLYEVLAHRKDLKVFVINPVHISKSLGLTRGKNDKIDAIRIAHFIEKNHTELEQWVAQTQEIKELKILFTERKHMVHMIAANKQKIKSLTKHKKATISTKIIRLYEQQIRELKRDLEEIEHLIKEIINNNEDLKRKDQLAQSVPGVGKVLSWQLLCKTEGFTKYTDPRKLACCAGVVPFSYSSGSSIRSKSRVSKMADLRLKSTLQMAAMRAIQMDNKLRDYYLRKVEEGKNKMAVLNAIRNKIIHIVIAIIKNNRFYQNNLVVS